jgi:hypothetical protein
MFYIRWIGDAVKSLDFFNSPMGWKLVLRMLIVLNWGEPVYGIWICVSVWKSGGLETYWNNSPIRLYLHFVFLNILTLE